MYKSWVRAKLKWDIIWGTQERLVCPADKDMHPVVRQAISVVSNTGHHWIPAVCLYCFSRDEHVDQFLHLTLN